MPSSTTRVISPSGSVPARPSFTANRSAKSASMNPSTMQTRGLVAEVAEFEVLAHPLAHVAGPEHQQGGVGRLAAGCPRETKVAREGVGVDRGQPLEPAPVDAQLEPRQDPGVAHEQPVGAAGHHVPAPGR